MWVKSFADAFPWAASFREDNKRVLWERFSDGWLIFLTGQLLLQWPAQCSFESPFMTLTIGGLHTQGMVQLDVLAVLKEANSDVYQEWIGDGLAGGGGNRIHIKRFYFNVQEGMVVVGLRATKWYPGGHRSQERTSVTCET